MALTDAQVQALVAEPNWLHYREEDSITQISGTPTVVTRLLMRQLVLTGKMEDLDAVKVYLGTVKEYTAPQVGKGRAQAGTWTNGGHFVSKEQADENEKRSWNLVQILYQGSNSTLTYAVEKSCAYLVEAIKYFGLAEPPTLPAAGITAGYAVSYEMVSQTQDQQTNAWTVVVLKRTRLEQSITYTSESAASYTETTAVKLGTVDGASALAPGDGQYLTQQITKNPDCSNNKVLGTQTAVKLEVSKTYTDAGGASSYYAGQNLTEAELDAKLAAISATANAQPTFARDPKFKDRYSLTLRQTPDNGSTPMSNAQYDLIGEFIEPWQDRDTLKEYCRVTLYTRSKTAAQSYAIGQLAGPYSYGLLSDVDVVVVSGIKTNWGAGNSYVVESKIYRNRGTGRYVASRVQRKA